MSLRSRIAELFEHLRAIPKSIDGLADAIRQTENSRRDSRGERSEAQHPARHRRVWIQELTAWFTGLGFLAAAIYAGISYCQLKVLEQQTTNAARAWVGFDQEPASKLPVTIDSIQVTPPDYHVTAHYTVENFGNGSAIKAVLTGWVEPDTALIPAEESADSVCESSSHFSTGTAPHSPNVPDVGRMGSVLFPAQTLTDSIDWTGPATAELKWIIVLGCVSYIDQFKNPHWTRFAVIVGDGVNTVSDASPQKLYSLYNDTDETNDRKPKAAVEKMDAAAKHSN